MLSEPKSQRPNLPQYHQFVTTNHTITSHIASLSYYGAQFGNKYAQEDFRPMINEIVKRFDQALVVIDNGEAQPIQAAARLPINKKVQQLLEQRKKDLVEGVESDPQTVRRTLSELKTVTDQYQLIYAALSDQVKILAKIRK
jgi:uncharacterized membrane protein YccC